MTFVQSKRAGAVLLAALALGSVTVHASAATGAAKQRAGTSTAARADGVKSPERWYYLGGSEGSLTYIDRQQELRRGSRS